MIDHLLRTAGHWSDPAVRQKIITQAARILGARGAETWPDAFERLRNRLHLAPGILEHQTLTESIDRDHNPAGLHPGPHRRAQRPAPGPPHQARPPVTAALHRPTALCRKHDDPTRPHPAVITTRPRRSEALTWAQDRRMVRARTRASRYGRGRASRTCASRGRAVGSGIAKARLSQSNRDTVGP